MLRLHKPDMPSCCLACEVSHAIALMTIFMKKYFSSVGINSSGWHPLRVYLLLQQAMRMTYGIYWSMLQHYLLFLKWFLYCIHYFLYRCFFLFILCMSMFTKWSLEESFVLFCFFTFYWSVSKFTLKIIYMKCLNYLHNRVTGQWVWGGWNLLNSVLFVVYLECVWYSPKGRLEYSVLL